MRFVALIILLSVVSVKGDHRPQESSKPKDNQSQLTNTDNSPANRLLISPNATAPNKSARHKKIENYLAKAFGPEFLANWLLVIAGGVGIWCAVKTLRLLEEQTLASIQAANAANNNIVLFINKERARLRADLKPLDLPLNERYFIVSFAVILYGTTPAFILEANCSAVAVPAKEIDGPELMSGAMTDIHVEDAPFFPTTIAPSDSPIKGYSFLFPGVETKDALAQLYDVREDRLFVVVRGLIKYKDVFEGVRETPFRYVWKFSQRIAKNNPNRVGAWFKCGPAEQNTET